MSDETHSVGSALLADIARAAERAGVPASVALDLLPTVNGSIASGDAYIADITERFPQLVAQQQAETAEPQPVAFSELDPEQQGQHMLDVINRSRVATGQAPIGSDAA